MVHSISALRLSTSVVTADRQKEDGLKLEKNGQVLLLCLANIVQNSNVCSSWNLLDYFLLVFYKNLFYEKKNSIFIFAQS